MEALVGESEAPSIGAGELRRVLRKLFGVADDWHWDELLDRDPERDPHHGFQK